MKLMTPAEVKTSREAELKKDIMRTQGVKSALNKVNEQLTDTEARFEVALANQRVRWANEEVEATERLQKLLDEIKAKEIERDNLLIPIEAKQKKTDDMYATADNLVRELTDKKREAEQSKQESIDLQTILTARLDDISEREQNVGEREQKVQIREESARMERENIRKLSKELSSKLNIL